MKLQEVEIAAPNSLVLVMDSEEAEIPPTMEGEVAASTASCIAVGTLESSDGSTKVRLVPAGEADWERIPPLEVADSELRIDSGALVIANILGDVYMKWLLHEPRIRVRIYVNHSVEPSKIAVILG